MNHYLPSQPGEELLQPGELVCFVSGIVYISPQGALFLFPKCISLDSSGADCFAFHNTFFFQHVPSKEGAKDRSCYTCCEGKALGYSCPAFLSAVDLCCESTKCV